MTPELNYEIKNMIVATAVAGVIIGAFVMFSFWLYDDDPWKLVRFLTSYVTSATVAVLVMAWALLLIDWVTPGNFLASVENDSMACAVLAGCITIGVSLILCFT